MTDRPSSLGVICAMPEEAEALSAFLGGGASRESHGGREFIINRSAETDVVLVISRVGKVSAAAAAMELIIRFGVRALIVTGVAGAMRPEIEIGDVVVATELVHHDLDASPIWPPRVVPLLEVERFGVDPEISRHLLDTATEFCRRLDRPQPPRVHSGLIASGDLFVSSAALADRVRSGVPDAAAVEMEGAAVAQVAHEYGIPVAVVRAISDRAGDHTESEYTASLSAFAASYSRGIVGGLLSDWLGHDGDGPR
ncbi:MAG: 5'-methylthioadenosine/adenosylhomocysteine nucleosidase [Planctomycetota bacterium]